MKNVEFSWTRKNVKALRDYRRAGVSAREIAALLGTTKNAISGKIDRLKLPLGQKPGEIAVVEPKPVKAGPKPIPKLTRDQHILPKNTKQVIALRRNACRWIDGNVFTEDFKYCRAPKQSGGSSYCTVHHKRVWVKPERRL